MALTALMLGLGQRVQAQGLGPTLMMFYGEPLTKPVHIAGADIATFGSLVHGGPPRTHDTAGRTFISVALFWGPTSNPAMNRVPIAQLTPQMAGQHGRFYPATATQPALLIFTTLMKQAQAVPTESGLYGWGGPISPAAVAVLKRAGIPTGPR
jgi:hypothetical protein